MKLLLDQNLSRKLANQLSPRFPGTEHTSTLGLEQAGDIEVWNHAKANGFSIVTKDTDFLHLAILRGQPPKIIHLDIGNCPTSHIYELLASSLEKIRTFAADTHHSFMTLRTSGSPVIGGQIHEPRSGD